MVPVGPMQHPTPPCTPHRPHWACGMQEVCWVCSPHAPLHQGISSKWSQQVLNSDIPRSTGCWGHEQHVLTLSCAAPVGGTVVLCTPHHQCTPPRPHWALGCTGCWWDHVHPPTGNHWIPDGVFHNTCNRDNQRDAVNRWHRNGPPYPAPIAMWEVLCIPAHHHTPPRPHWALGMWRGVGDLHGPAPSAPGHVRGFH